MVDDASNRPCDSEASAPRNHPPGVPIMATHTSDPDPLDSDELDDLPDDLVEDIERESNDDLGDETQSNEERTALEGMEQKDFIDPRGEDDESE
jgi:hypothetical protein